MIVVDVVDVVNVREKINITKAVIIEDMMGAAAMENVAVIIYVSLE